MKILVVAAHPDDEVLGIGGTIAKHIKRGDSVFVCMVTSAYGPEWSEKYLGKKLLAQQAVDKLLKIKQRYNLDLPTVKLNTLPHGELNKRINEVINDVGPDIIYTHFENDPNYDHTLVFRACLIGTRPPKKIKLFAFETLSETEWDIRPFAPNYYVELDKKAIDLKIKAFKLYKTEVKKYPHPRSPEGIEILAKKRGLDICARYAEAFILHRGVWR